MDEVDLTTERAEFNYQEALSASRKPRGPEATGRCLYCDEIVADDVRWCCPEHRDAWEREAVRGRY